MIFRYNIEENIKIKDFLKKINLCEMYERLGEESLCATCADYPRHIEEFENLREITLTVSCPEVARILLEQKEPVKFTEEEIAEFFENPYVISGIRAKNRAIVFDFLAQNKKQDNEICTILDLHVEQEEAEEISAFFCEEVGKREEKIKLSFEKNGAYVRVILRGYEDSVMEILNKYYHLG